jgi:hypothetical protein
VDGICTLGNDVVFDQIVALLNSIEVNQGKDTPVCIYPYDDRLERLSEEVAKRPNVTIYDDKESIKRWEDFTKSVWDLHPTAKQLWQSRDSVEYHRMGMNRRFCGFDGPFERFVYMDGDTLLIQPFDPIFQRLDTYDFVTYDFQHKDLSHVFVPDSPKLPEVFSSERTSREIFCAGLFASKRDRINLSERERALELLADGEVEILYPNGPDQTLLNYLVLRLGISACNLSFDLPKEQVTGCCVTSPHFKVDGGQVTDHGVAVTYLHYIGVPASIMARLCQGENLDVPYRDVFLHYRFLHDPELRPTFTGTPKPYNPAPTLLQRAKRKLKRVMNR